jgi:predicted Zn finger-like uncharacterized protein
MPIRLTCPSCSATLSVKDEYAGRAVKCPKCGGVIPASAGAPAPAAASPPPSKPAPALPPEPAPAPPPAPEKSPFEDLDEPAKPAKSGGKITGKPVSKSRDEDDDDDDRPRKKKRDEDDDRDDDRPAKSKKKDRDEDDRDEQKSEKGKKGDRDDKDDDDRPVKKKRRGDDDDDDRPGRGEKKKGGGGMIILLICGALLLCCGGIGGAVYWFVIKAKEGIEDIADSLTPKNDKLTKENYQKLKPLMTQSEIESIIGKGSSITTFHLNTIWEADTAENKKRKSEVATRMDQGRAYVWRNKDDYVIVVYHDKPGAGGKLQEKYFATKGGSTEHVGTWDDAQFARENPGLKTGGGPGGDAISVSAEELSRAFNKDPDAAKTKYMDKEVIVEGKLTDIEVIGDDVTARLTGSGDRAYVHCNVQKADAKEVWKTSRTQTVKFRGKCIFGAENAVTLDGCKFVSRGQETALGDSAAAFLNEFAKNSQTAEAKYADKPVTITNAVVQSKAGNSVTLVGAGGKSSFKITATLPADYTKQLSSIKNGDTITIKGEFSSVDGQVININRAWIVPK